jgi:MFS family permease
MRDRLASAARDRWRAGRAAFAEPNLRRLNLAHLTGQLGGWSYFVAISVYAFSHGGAKQVGLMTVLRLTPAMLFAPFAGALADRYPRRAVLICAELGRAGAQSLAAVLIISGAPPVSVYLAVAASSLVGTAFEPAKAALLPSLATTPEQLTAANALGATIESTGLTLGPALGGALLVVSSPQVVLLVFAGACVGSALLITRIDREESREPEHTGFLAVARRSLAGFTTLAGDRTLRIVVGVFSMQMLAFGVLNVFIVTIALKELHIGAGGTGALNTAAGVGGIIGGVLTINLAGRRLTTPLGFGMAVLGGAYLLAGAFSNEPVALLAICCMNLGGWYVDIATFTLLQRAVDEKVLARAFSVIGTIIVGALLVGGAVAPALISALGLREALAATGGAVLLCIASALPALRRIDAAAPRPLDGLALLRGLPLFSALPVPVLERLAADLQDESFDDGQEIVAQGAPGDDYFIISEGEAEVRVDGRPITRLAAGEGFGEIALLLDSPRTATVLARGEIRVVRLKRDQFLGAVTGHEPTREAGHALASSLLSRARPASMNL